jgi:hypothetical protein
VVARELRQELMVAGMDVGMPDPRKTRVLRHDAAEPPLGIIQPVLPHHRSRDIEEEGVVVAHESRDGSHIASGEQPRRMG